MEPYAYGGEVAGKWRHNCKCNGRNESNVFESREKRGEEGEGREGKRDGEEEKERKKEKIPSKKRP